MLGLLVWDIACAGIGMAGRIPHDLRRSGVKHYISAGIDPHTVMKWSGHRTMSTLLRYHIISLDDLRRAGKKASDYQGPRENVRPLRSGDGRGDGAVGHGDCSVAVGPRRGVTVTVG